MLCEGGGSGCPACSLATRTAGSHRREFADFCAVSGATFCLHRLETFGHSVRQFSPSQWSYIFGKFLPSHRVHITSG